MSLVEPPGEQAGERVSRRAGHCERAVFAEHRDSDRAGVEALRVRADDVLVDPAAATLEDLAEPVDEKVVADVVPAVSLDVVDLDRLHDRRRLSRVVAVRACCVMDDRDSERRRDGGLGADDRLVGLPAGAGHDRRHARALQRPRRHVRGLAPDEVRSQAGDGARAPILDPVGRPDPPRVPEPPTLRARPLGRPRVGLILGLRRCVHPFAPATLERARAELHASGSPPVHADEVESRGSTRKHAARPDCDIARDDRRVARPGLHGQRGRESEQEQEAKLLHGVSQQWRLSSFPTSATTPA